MKESFGGLILVAKPFFALRQQLPDREFIYHISERMFWGPTRDQNEEKDGQENQFMMFLIYFKNNSVGKLNFPHVCAQQCVKASQSIKGRKKRQTQKISNDDDGLK